MIPLRLRPGVSTCAKRWLPNPQLHRGNHGKSIGVELNLHPLVDRYQNATLSAAPPLYNPYSRN